MASSRISLTVILNLLLNLASSISLDATRLHAGSTFHEEHERLLDGFRDPACEARGVGAVDDAVVVG